MNLITHIDVNKFFNVDVQYRVPLFQRRYIWNEANWERLWRDILDQLDLELIEDPDGKFVCQKREHFEDTPDLTLDEESNRRHFTGILVTRPISGEVLDKFEVIDGQQRLTTFQIILCVIRDIFQSDKQDDKNEHVIQANEANNLIVNVPSVAERYSDATYKFVPIEYDKDEFEVVAKGEYGSLISEVFDETSGSIDYDKLSAISNRVSLKPEDLDKNVLKAYNHFYEWVRGYMEEDFVKLDDLLNIIKNKFTFAIMLLVKGDKSEEIYESLNATGQKLSEFDYLRNNLFLRARSLGVDKDSGKSYNDFYTDYWHYFDKKENRSYWTTETLDEFFCVFLKAKLGPNCFDAKNVKPYEVYQRYSKGLKKGIQHEFEQLNDYAVSYKEMNSFLVGNQPLHGVL